jgi:hypothetical protein
LEGVVHHIHGGMAGRMAVRVATNPHLRGLRRRL